MGKKRKHSETQTAEPTKKDEGAPERPTRTLLGWKVKDEAKQQTQSNTDSSQFFRNKAKVMVTCSRRINYRKHQDLYMWMARSPSGQSVKFLVNAVHTMEELKLTGPFLTFSSNFEKDAHWKLLKEMIIQIFGTLKEHRKSKLYHDHIFVFSIVDDHIWFRNYQISVPHNESDKMARGGLNKMTLIEVGPRFCLNPIKIFIGSFKGPTLYENPFYVSPNQNHSMLKNVLESIAWRLRRMLVLNLYMEYKCFPLPLLVNQIVYLHLSLQVAFSLPK
ncbi:ribosome biogenesis protein BRX1 homolog 2 isoform X2 [Gossypium hirsutum]|uniref:Ribosome biogenesis protein BRX1 homolog 2 isoform X2 n=1 Tax=Gossypium hirsutum TaxID=3635 RepID=A0ABM3BI54_GOSHI|nr:ribosome biogenesis protein BRX1 homolog 2-like isoform X2 [Gossypium hirsutum]